MGANQSTSAGGAGSGAGTKTCYYELLGILPSATDDEVKKAYRKKALELHPDRNFGNVQVTTNLFAEVQSAYEVLSDPQERAWYDSHRVAILQGDDGSGADSREHDVRMTTARDILGLFRTFNGQIKFSDAPDGFFGALGETFAGLAREEAISSEWLGLVPPDFPSFGYSSDDYQTGVKKFYSSWASFATEKTFSWKDVYKISDAPDRRVRRLMEKENKRRREEAIKEFNDAVRSLVAFVKKRDPRVPISKESDAARQGVLKEAALSQAARSRAANQAKIAIVEEMPEWMRSSAPPENEVSADETSNEAREEIECAVCGKAFKSEKQYESHAKSKKHLKAVQRIEWQMRRDAQQLGLDEERLEGTEKPRPHNHDNSVFQRRSSGVDQQQDETRSRRSASSAHTTSSERSRTDSLDRPRVEMEVVDNREMDSGTGSSTAPEEFVIGKEIPDQALRGPNKSPFSHEHEGIPGIAAPPSKPRLGKAKEKKAKRAARNLNETGTAKTATHECRTCHTTYVSKTKLFKHLEDSGHASIPDNKSAKGRVS